MRMKAALRNTLAVTAMGLTAIGIIGFYDDPSELEVFTRCMSLDEYKYRHDSTPKWYGTTQKEVKFTLRH
ncbi:MAG: hypothetical protein ABR981_00935 [Candidatus Micrarchaeaceae archaeon]|jgi:hypothetical protein